MAQVEARFTTVPSVQTLTITTRNVQSAYQQSDLCFLTSRRPFETPAVSGAEVIVLQFGSRHLKLALARDALPHTVPQVIAHRNAVFAHEPRSTGQLSEEELQERFALRYRSAKKKPPPNIYTSVVSFNKSSVAQIIPALNDAYGFDWTRTASAKYITGQAALRINPQEPYRRRWPIKRGSFNTFQYRTSREVLDDLDKIWTSAIFTHLKIAPKDFSSYGVVLVVPDAVCAAEINGLTELALKTMGFRSVAFILESVATTFGAGVSSACVIDVGAQKTSVCCVEDGQIVSETQSIMPYGGDELSVLLLQMLKLQHFPYTQCDLTNPLDFELIEDLKIRLCTMDEEELSSQVYEAFVRNPGTATKVYPFKVFEERILVPLALFEDGAALLSRFSALDGTSTLHFTLQSFAGIYYALENADCVSEMPLVVENPADEKAIDADANGQSAINVPCRWAGCSAHLSTVEEAYEHLEKGHSIDSKCQWDSCEAAGPFADDLSRSAHIADHLYSAAQAQHQGKVTATAKSTVDLPVVPTIPGSYSMLSLSEALFKALDALDPAASPERVKKMIGSILIVGNGHKFSQFVPYVEEMLRGRYPGYEVDFVLGGGAGSVMSTKDSMGLDAGIVPWKGGAVFAKLECTQDAWITSRDFDTLSIRVFRDRLGFVTSS